MAQVNISYIVRHKNARVAISICEDLSDAESVRENARLVNPQYEYIIVRRTVSDEIVA